MPCRHVDTPDGPGFRWGHTGTVYTYGPHRSAHEAAALAIRQGRARAARAFAQDLTRADARQRLGRRPRFSERLTTTYERMLHARVDLAERLLLDYAAPMIRRIEGPRTDASRTRTPVGASIFDVLRAVREGTTGAAPADAEGLVFLGEEIDEDVTAATDRQVGRLLNIPLASATGSGEAVAGWVSANVTLISSLPAQSLDEIEGLVHAAMSGGRPTRNLMADIQARFGVSRSRASLIARDQTAKLAGQINMDRQTAYGIDSYQWSTSGDPRVRSAHAQLDGRIFTWAEGAPSERGGHIHPGEEFQCRCDGIPVLPGANRGALVAEAVARQERELQLMRASPTVQGEVTNRSGFSDWNEKRIREIRRGTRSAVGLRAV